MQFGVPHPTPRPNCVNAYSCCARGVLVDSATSSARAVSWNSRWAAATDFRSAPIALIRFLRQERYAELAVFAYEGTDNLRRNFLRIPTLEIPSYARHFGVLTEGGEAMDAPYEYGGQCVTQRSRESRTEESPGSTAGSMGSAVTIRGVGDDGAR